MIRVSNNAVSPDVAASGTTGASPVPKAATAAQIFDQVELSRLAAAVSKDRSRAIAALKASVASQDYLPPSLPVIRKLVSGALSRPD
jgi:hypothetical protein